MPLLDVQNLFIRIGRGESAIDVVRDISFSVGSGEIVGILGESGCGKSLTAFSVLGLLPQGLSAAGQIKFDGRDLLSLGEQDLCALRGNRIGMIFQEPATALNPVQTVGDQIAEPLRLHTGMGKREARAETLHLLERIHLPNPRAALDVYPHQMSGGQRQRVVIAMALACRPSLLIADEPTTALDTTVQRQILDLLLDLVDETKSGLLLITHDIGVMAEMTERVLVMYGGVIVESGPTEKIITDPAHPYTRALLRAVPQRALGYDTWLESIPGTVPAPSERLRGCLFRSRCSLAGPECEVQPDLIPRGPDRVAACWRLPQVDGSVPA
ncbi:MAG: ABC transporter ATP-binding protein [Rhizobiales bacterium]|nr:ABC transporter ATP-binding protein [Hyphomicrobiales bacterium]